MPQQTQPARLWKRPTNGIWIIRDKGRKQVSTGTRDRSEAERALARYIIENEADRTIGRRSPDRITVAELLLPYAQHHAPTRKDPERIAYAIEALVPILGDLPVSEITGGTCRRYAKIRNRAPGTIRKELGTLQAAINWCVAEGYLTASVKVKLPTKPAPRDRWLSRDEAAKLLRAARRNPRGRHLARFILVALYTGTRSEAILRMQFMPNTEGGHVNTERGLMYRRAIGSAETKKRTPTIPIPARLLSHLRRWERMGSRYVVEVGGCRVGHVKRSWSAAIAESGIEHCTRHDLRHTAITWALQNGMDRWAASGFFGVSMDVLERVYGHHDPEHMRTALDAIDHPGKAKVHTLAHLRAV